MHIFRKTESLYAPYEHAIMKRFKKGAKIQNEEEELLLEEYGGIGFVDFSADFSVARLTEIGRAAL
ncbi:hypothetical protein KKC56_03990 [Patescibacteria group bacterium]|nr:hypothetical protein [Patescibacteria group bacterium]MBU1684592.1 hypothetical protein [Patescibacteria group bacterium]MBU1778731.1 hypothetical protein [Patescibacteria group bacterium]MBU1987243.1 hypothetical protein [Patescibacteria group bacterium]